MSILIKGMEMPTEVCFVNVMLCNDGRVFVYKNGEWGKIGNAIPVPPHGNLKDADEFRELLTTALNDPNVTSPVIRSLMETIITAIDDAPTIIPAEEGE